MSRRVVAAIAVALVSLAAAALLVVEKHDGAAHFGRRDYVDPCTAPPDPFHERGVDAVLQRIALSALNGAACELRTSREDLVLSLAPRSGFDAVHWDRPTVEHAVRVGLRRAIDDAVKRGSLPRLAAAPLRLLVDHAPLRWLLDRLHIAS